ATIGELSGLAALKQQMEAAEDEGPEGASEQPPVGEAPSEAQSKAVEAEQPEEEAPAVTGPGASTDLEGQIGVGNRGSVGTDLDEEGDPEGDARSGQNPPAEQSQRLEETGSVPAAEQ